MTLKNNKGFTLTELIMVIVIISIISAVVGPLIGNKFSAVSQSSQRATWVQQAEFALFHIRQDLGTSIPNSACTTTNANCDSGDTLEFLGVQNRNRDFAARYRDRQRNPYDRLQTNNDDAFDVFGLFSNLPNYVSIGVDSPADARTHWQSATTDATNSKIARISSYDNTLTEDDNNAATNPNPSITNIELINNNHRFGGHSPFFRAYFTDGPIGYECNGGTLWRVSNYTSMDSSVLFSTRTAAASVDKVRITDSVTACSFQVRGGAPFQPPTVEVSISIGEGSETVTLNDIIVLGNGS
ncbi:prepilin-type N-terminal cleavage/methylation domain-containing protein [Reinekea marina]|uniref:Prepilin-type N-terminal cleavage/methylation domain-containing protein n=1 Tax=Reinekea marina TaxID=1310421 RepID=A0ABV7WR25_9GAMM|nr:prepilin-type N-terminal cleavage/methylation domain-containing protein [Reinekea marina]MDN3650500.1 prepilin-type N-terminal cleavage/methylation domain-containing protein [Reinekea marina]